MKKQKMSRNKHNLHFVERLTYKKQLVVGVLRAVMNKG